jgi:hypothetical protein
MQTGIIISNERKAKDIYWEDRELLSPALQKVQI